MASDHLLGYTGVSHCSFVRSFTRLSPSSSLENLDVMFNTGLFINDLSMHDSSRDLVLAGTQQSAELKLALDQVRATNCSRKSRRLSFAVLLGTTEKQSSGRQHEEVGCGNEKDRSVALSNDS
jgi:hypothetical protein